MPAVVYSSTDVPAVVYPLTDVPAVVYPSDRAIEAPCWSLKIVSYNIFLPVVSK